MQMEQSCSWNSELSLSSLHVHLLLHLYNRVFMMGPEGYVLKSIPVCWNPTVGAEQASSVLLSSLCMHRQAIVGSVSETMGHTWPQNHLHEDPPTPP